MKKLKVKIDELAFELSYESGDDQIPKVEIENNTSMLFITLNMEKAIELRNLLNLYIQAIEDRKNP
jgi:hypothetical protein